MVKKTPGRPSLPEKMRKSKNFTFRGTADLHERLRQAAAISGRTVSDEIVERLSGSFGAAEMINKCGAAGAIGQVAIAAMSAAGETAGILSALSPQGAINWQDDPTAYDQAVRAAVAVLEQFRPTGAPAEIDVRGLPESTASALANIGQTLAAEILMEAATGESARSQMAWRANTMHSGLGSLVERARTSTKAKRQR